MVLEIKRECIVD